MRAFLLFFLLFAFGSLDISAKEESSQHGERTTNLQDLIGKEIYILSINGQAFNGHNISKSYLAYYYLYAVADTSNILLKKKELTKETTDLNGALTVIKTFSIDAGKTHKESTGILVKDDGGKFFVIKVPLWVGYYPRYSDIKKNWEHFEKAEIEFIDSKPFRFIEAQYKDSVLFKLSKNYHCNAIAKKATLTALSYDAKYTKKVKLCFSQNGKTESIYCKQSPKDSVGDYDITHFSKDFVTQTELTQQSRERYGEHYEDSIAKTLKQHLWYIEKTPTNCYHYKDNAFYYVKEGDYKFDRICLKEPLILQNKNYQELYRYHLKFTNSSDTIEFYVEPQTDIMNFLVDADLHKKEIQAKEAKEKQEELLEREKEEREERIYKQSLVKKYGAKNAALILDEQVRIGFTKEMCVESWGEPRYINSTITRYGRQEQWVYGIGCYLYFVGNKLTGIQNMK